MGSAKSSGKLDLSRRSAIRCWRLRLRSVIIRFTRNPSVKLVFSLLSTNETPHNAEGFRVFSFYAAECRIGHACLGARLLIRKYGVCRQNPIGSNTLGSIPGPHQSGRPGMI